MLPTMNLYKIISKDVKSENKMKSVMQITGCEPKYPSHSSNQTIEDKEYQEQIKEIKIIKIAILLQGRQYSQVLVVLRVYI